MTQVSEGSLRDAPVRSGLVWTLGLGAFGLAFSITTTAAYLPFILHRFTSSGSLIGSVLGAEGVFAITLPVVIGSWSDTFHTPLGRRRPFMLAALGPMGFSLALVPFMPSFWTMALMAFAFFFAYYVYEPPYRGLYPDLLEPRAYARSQGVQHILRGIAIGGGLVGGGSVMTLAWGLLFELMPAEHRGAISGLATTTKGFGLIAGPIVAGAAIDLSSPFLRATDGYQIL